MSELSETTLIVYCRQSRSRPGERLDTSLSIEAQESFCRTWGERLGYGRFGETIVDYDTAGDNLDREGVHRILAKSAPNVHFVAYKWDRFARSEHLQETVIRQIEALGSLIFSATEPSDRFGRGIYGLMAEQHKLQLVDRLRTVFRTRALRGRHHGEAPFGYWRPNTGIKENSDGSEHAYRTGDIEVHPEQAAIVREIFERLAAGEPANQIAIDLNQRGVRSSRGTGFRFDSIVKIARNPIYTGHIRYRGSIICDEVGTPVINPAYQIIDQEQWDAVQRQIASRAGVHKPKRSSSWLEGLVIHECGAPMYYLSRLQAKTRAEPGTGFMCANYAPRKNPELGCILRPASISEPKLAMMVKTCLATDMAGIVSVRAARAEMRRSVASREVISKRDQLTTKRAEITRRYERVVQAWVEDVVEIDKLREFRDQKDRELRTIDDQLAALPDVITDEDLERTHAALSSLGSVVMHAPADALHAALVDLGKVVVGPDGVTIRYLPHVALYVPHPHCERSAGRRDALSRYR